MHSRSVDIKRGPMTFLETEHNPARSLCVSKETCVLCDTQIRVSGEFMEFAKPVLSVVICIAHASEYGWYGWYGFS